MLDHKEILRRLVRGANGAKPVRVRETNFGYIISSGNGGRDDVLRQRIYRYWMLAALIGAAGLWLVPGLLLLVKFCGSAVLLAAVYAGVALFGRAGGGIELHVDTARRELRAAVVTAKGESWIRDSARFSEVTGPVLRHSGKDRHSLCLRIAGEADVMPVAVGDEETLLAVHHRLMGDLRPIEERLAGFKLNAARGGSRAGEVFPQLGPDVVGV